MELISCRELAAAGEVVERGWALVDSQPADISVLRLAVARAIVAVETDAPERVLQSVERAERAEGPQPDLFHLRGRALVLLALRTAGAERRRALAGAEAAFRAAIAMAGREPLREYVAGASSWASWTGIGEVMLCLDRPADALVAFGEALVQSPQSHEAGLGEVEAMLHARPAQALARVERLLDCSPDGWVLADAAARSVGAVGDARALVRQALARRANKFRSSRRAGLLARMASELGVRLD